jgi:hypothetical protein
MDMDVVGVLILAKSAESAIGFTDEHVTALMSLSEFVATSLRCVPL